MKFKRHDTVSQGIDISPLIDMVFILLIFFMVTTTFDKDQKLDINRPGASSATTASTKSIRVAIEASGRIWLNGQETRSWVLQSRVREILDQDRKQPVLVVTDKGVPADILIEVVDQCRLAGAGDVGVATRRETEGQG